MTDSESHRVIGGATIQHHEEDAPIDVNNESDETHASDDGDASPTVTASSNLKTKQSSSSTLQSFVASTFGFNRLPFTVVFLFIYTSLIIIISYVQSTSTPYVPNVYDQKYIKQSWLDLQEISKDFHPYGSHANDDVRDYLLNQINSIVSSSSADIVVDANPQKIMFAQGDVFDKSAPTGKLSYHESNNILVKFPGSDPSLKAVLLSAHFDSVPTGHGTTDDGAGISSLLAVLRYLNDIRQYNDTQLLRTVIFNFNNNEEFGLLGAEAFVRHQWFDEVESFLNLEGAGSGGRPVLFRTTDYGVAKHYSAANAPHGNSIPQQAFDLGLVHSETDFSVYKRHGLRGLDIAFYKPRSLYHTNRDSIKHMSLQSLSHMLTNAIDVTVSLANVVSYGENDLAVYFDVFGIYFIILPLTSLFVLNIIGLILGPIAVGLLWAAVVKRHSWTIRVGWYRGIIALILSFAITYGGIQWLLQTNPFIFASQIHSPLLAAFGLFLTTSYTILGLADYFWPVHDQKLVIFIELFFIWWIYLVYSTVEVANNATGQYIATILYYLGLFAVIIGLLGHLIIPDSLSYSYNDEEEEELGEQRQVEDANATETTTLLDHASRNVDFITIKPLSLSFDWLLQFITIVPIGVYLAYSTGLLLLDMIHQTLDDSNENIQAILAILLTFSFLLSALVLPFLHRLHTMVVLILVFITVIGGINSFTSFPFTHDSPHKMRFRQSINLDDNTAIVKIFNTGEFAQSVLSDLPSVKQGGGVECLAGIKGNTTCQYEGPRPWIISNKPNYTDWLRIEKIDGKSENKGPNKGELFIYAPDVRRCTLSFNTSTFKSNDPDSSHVSPVRAVIVYHDMNSTDELESGGVAATGWESSEEADVFKYPFGIDDVTIHKLNWSLEGFHIGIEWIPQWLEDGYDNDLGVQVTCYWGEYDQEVIFGNQTYRKIPALDEVLEYSPLWVSWVNWGAGLVEVTKHVGL